MWEGERRTGDGSVRRESANEKSLESNWAWRTARKGGVEEGGGVVRVVKRVMRSA